MQGDQQQPFTVAQAVPTRRQGMLVPQLPDVAAGGAGRAEQGIAQQARLRERDAHDGHGETDAGILHQGLGLRGRAQAAVHRGREGRGRLYGLDRFPGVHDTCPDRPGQVGLHQAPQMQVHHGDGHGGPRAVPQQCDLVRLQPGRRTVAHGFTPVPGPAAPVPADPV
ncbi:hypothetical protein GCM10023097_23890 [Streptomyces collinus]